MFLLIFLLFVVSLVSSPTGLSLSADVADDRLGGLLRVSGGRNTTCGIIKLLWTSCLGSKAAADRPIITQNVFHARDTTNSSSQRWTKTQIIIPIATGLVLTIAFIILFICYRRPPSPTHHLGWTDGTARGPRRLCGLLSDVRKVRGTDRGSLWTIDRHDSYDRIRLGRSGSRESRAQHVRLPSSPSPFDSSATSPVKPWHKNYQDSDSLGKESRQSLASARKMLNILPTPWKPKAVVVSSQRPKFGFRIDDLDATAQVPLPKSSTLDSKNRITPDTAVDMYIVDSRHGVNYQGECAILPAGIRNGEEDESDSDSGLGDSDVDEEQTLFSSAGPSVRSRNYTALVSSSRGPDFSIDLDHGDCGSTGGAVQAISPSISSPGWDADLSPPPSSKYPSPLPPALSPPSHLRNHSTENTRRNPYRPPSNGSPRERDKKTLPTRATAQPISPSPSPSRPHSQSPTKRIKRSYAHVRKPSEGNISCSSSGSLVPQPWEESNRIRAPSHHPSPSLNNLVISSPPHPSGALSSEYLPHPDRPTHPRKYPSEGFIPPLANPSFYPPALREIVYASKFPDGHPSADIEDSNLTR